MVPFNCGDFLSRCSDEHVQEAVIVPRTIETSWRICQGQGCPPQHGGYNGTAAQTRSYLLSMESLPFCLDAKIGFEHELEEKGVSTLGCPNWSLLFPVH